MKKTIAVFALLAIAFVLGACQAKAVAPPDAEEVGAFAILYQKEIGIINDYLMGLGSVDAFIDDSNESILIDLTLEAIENSTVNEAIRLLWQNGCKEISKSIDDNVITYMLWSRNFDDTDCGLAYAINPLLPPKVQFQTKLTPLSDEGWYYYLAEYNAWRTREQVDSTGN